MSVKVSRSRLFWYIVLLIFLIIVALTPLLRYWILHEYLLANYIWTILLTVLIGYGIFLPIIFAILGLVNEKYTNRKIVWAGLAIYFIVAVLNTVSGWVYTANQISELRSFSKKEEETILKRSNTSISKRNQDKIIQPRENVNLDLRGVLFLLKYPIILEGIIFYLLLPMLLTGFFLYLYRSKTVWNRSHSSTEKSD